MTVTFVQYQHDKRQEHLFYTKHDTISTIMTYTPKPYEIIEYKGQPARKYEDGAIRDERGYFLAKHPDGAPTITTDIAREYRARKIHKQQQAALMGVSNAIMKHRNLEYPVGTSEAWMMAAELVAEGLTSDKYRDRTDAMRVLSDITPSKYDKGSQQQQAAAPVQVKVDIVAVLLSHVVDKDSYLKHETVDAEAEDISE